MTKLFLTFLIGLLLCVPMHQAHAQNVTIPDDNLRTAIETALSLLPGAPITEAQMATLTTLEVTTFSRKNVKDLTGLEHATGLMKLTMQGAFSHSSPDKLVDISLLSGLTSLTYLDLQRNKIQDISPLEGLSALERLDLNSNPITDISILTKENFPALKYLNLYDTWVRDFSALDGDYWTKKFYDAPTSNAEDIEAGNALAICNSALENWDYGGNHSDINLAGAPLGKIDPMTFGWIDPSTWTASDRARIKDQLNKPTCAPVFRIKSTEDNTSVQLIVDADADLTANYVTLTYVYRYRKSGGSWPATSTDTATSQWTGGFVNPPPGEDRAPNYQGVIEAQNDEYAIDITGLDPSAVYHFQVFGSFWQGGNIRNIYPPGSQIRCWSTSTQSVVECPLDPTPATPTPPRTPRTPRQDPPLTVTFADYPEEKPIGEFTLTIRFSEPVIGFEKDDITVETELTRGKGEATLTELTPTTGHPDIGDLATDPAPLVALTTLPEAVQTYTATVELPARAIGTVVLIVGKDTAITPVALIGPDTDTTSEPIEFKRPVRIICPPSVVPMETIIFNEFRNAADDTHDWVELKNVSDEPVSLKEWEISQVLPHAVGSTASQLERIAMDRDVVAFPDVTLPAGGILLIVNTHPSETDLIRGQNIERPNYNPDIFPQFLIAPEMKLPSHPYLLILRSVRDKNGQWDGFEDLVGNYHHDDVGYATNIWPLRCTPVYTGTGARFSEGKVYERVMTQRYLTYKGNRTVPKAQGYFHDAWALTEQHAGLGYVPGASSEISLGTPGYSEESVIRTTVGSGEISISEVMVATDEHAPLSQWIELYNSTTEMVNLEGWQLRIEVRDHQPVHRHITFPLKSLAVMPRQTVLLVAQQDRNSGNIPMSRIYDVKRHHRKALLLREEGFALRLFSSDGTLVDMVGNLDGRTGRDKPRWELPSGWTETGARTSLIRRYSDGVPMHGNLSRSWVRAVETSLIGAYTYWGAPSDSGTPGYRLGSPLPVTLSSLRADLREGSVVVNWTTASEMENAGFNILRGETQKGQFIQVTPSLILGAGTTAEGQTYTYRDTTARPNVPYYYRLEEVSLSGERRAVATVRLRGHVSAANKLLWKWADVKSSD